MSRRRAHRLAPLLAVMLLALIGCAPGGGGDGIGGTGVRAGGDPEGIGGTGARYAGDPDGIGGTGIVGEITALGSVQVNGLWVRVPASASVRINGAPASARELARGQVVAVLALTEAGDLVAREVEVRDALVGRVDTVDRERAVVTLLGHRIRLSESSATVLADGLRLRSLSAGDRLRVSGLWRGPGDLEVTRVVRARAGEPDSVHGPVTAIVAGGVRIGPLEVRDVDASGVRPGQFVTVTGTARGGGLRAAALARTPAVPFPGRIARLVQEGYAGIGTGIGALAASGADSAALRSELAQAARDQRRVRVSGQVSGGVVSLERVQPASAPPRLLPRLNSGRLAPALGTPSPTPVPAIITDTQRAVRELERSAVDATKPGSRTARPPAMDIRLSPAPVPDRRTLDAPVPVRPSPAGLPAPAPSASDTRTPLIRR